MYSIGLRTRGKEIIKIRFMETLIKEDDTVLFLIEFEGDFESSATFNVFEVLCWDGETNEVTGTEKYLHGYIKWDGCSHVWFGKEDNPGYLHLCGKGFFERHKQVMDAIWDICSKRIIGWDEDVAS
jgi:hypothetical protein